MGYSRLDGPVQFLKGVGPRWGDALKSLGIGTARDLLYHIPRRYDDASTIRPIEGLRVGEEATIVGEVRTKAVLPTRGGLRIFQAVVQDASGYITCAWPGQPWLDRKIREGDRILATGPIRHFHGRQFHPREFTLLTRAGQHREEGDEPSLSAIFVTYPASDSVPQWVLRQILARNLETLLREADTDEYLSPTRLGALGLPPLSEALRRLHRPQTMEEPEGGRVRLAFDELFFLQLVQALARRRAIEAEPGIAFGRTNRFVRPLHDSLPFALTQAQARVLREIFEDMASGRRMNRFLQGDVGSGKTLVALFSMLLAAESGYQSVLMAPTELLAEQHADTIRLHLASAGLDSIEVVLLTGRVTGAERRRALAALANPEGAQLVVGTHALIQEGVTLGRLGLVIVDEQHRFGVRQRMSLTGEGGRSPGATPPDVLVMSATPIPRSLAMVLYGEMELSVLDELPPGRTPIETLLRRPSAREEVLTRVEEEVASGRQGYLIYPLVDESEKSELRSATEEYRWLSETRFPELRLGLLHGQLPSEEKDRIMRAFRDGQLDLLVATTVIEVGIDVPNASIIVIEHAERFGLSQLHQLRGRVGRGRHPSQCILIGEGGEESWTRLKLFRASSDGFAVARADLQLRGEGELFGARQHGRDPLLRFAELARDEGLLERARTLARGIVEEDPRLAAPEHARIQELLETLHAERLRLWRVG